MAENIRSGEYEKFLALKEQMKQGMEQSETEFMFQTYKKLMAVLNRRQEAAVKLNIVLENAETRELVKRKRDSFKTIKTS